MDLDNFIIGKTKERRGESWGKSSSCFGLRQFHHRQNKKEQLLPNIEARGEERRVGQLAATSTTTGCCMSLVFKIHTWLLHMPSPKHSKIIKKACLFIR
jgi:hypothetical protein